MSTSITYADVVTKQAVENWADERGLTVCERMGTGSRSRRESRSNSRYVSVPVPILSQPLIAEDQFILHLEERFGAHQVHVTSVDDQGDFSDIRLTTDQPRGEDRRLALEQPLVVAQGTAEAKRLLAAWPLARRPGWVEHVNGPQSEAELAALMSKCKQCFSHQTRRVQRAPSFCHPSFCQSPQLDPE